MRVMMIGPFPRSPDRIDGGVAAATMYLCQALAADLAGFLATGCGLPEVVTVHGLLGECARLQTHPTAKARAILAGLLTERPTVRRATDLISISPHVGQYYEGEIKGRVHQVPNAIAPRFFRLPRVPERGRLLFAGRIAKGKGPHDLVHAVARIPDKVRQVIFAGAAPDPAFESVLRADVERLGLSGRVRFAGLLDEPALLEEFARAEALVLPSYQETAPMVVKQAMAAGLALAGCTVAEKLCDATSVASATRMVYERIVGETENRRRRGKGT